MPMSPNTGSGSFLGIASKKRQSVSSVQSQAHKRPRLHPLRQTSFPNFDVDPRVSNSGKGDADGGSVTGSFTGSLSGSIGGKKKRSKKDREREREREREGTASVRGTGEGTRATKAGSAAEEQEDYPDGNEDEDDIEDDIDLMARDETAVTDAEAEKKNLAILIDAFTPEQSTRYDFFKRAKLNKAMVRKIVNQTLSQSVPPNVITTISGYTKVFIGELIERARTVQEEWAEVQDRIAMQEAQTKNADEEEPSNAKSANGSANDTRATGPTPKDPSLEAKHDTDDTTMHDGKDESAHAEASNEAETGASSTAAHELPANPNRGPLLPQHLREALRRYKCDGEGGSVGFSGLSMGAQGARGSFIWGNGVGGGRLFR